MVKYPLTYKEYEKKVIDLFLQSYPEELQETMIDRLDKLLEDEPEYIKGLYADTCFDYDHPEIYGEITKKSFEDYYLESTPVNNLIWYLEEIMYKTCVS